MNVLIIDNYDSFVYNIAQIVKKLGHNVEIISNDELSDTDNGKYQRFIISPGPGNPMRKSDRGYLLEFLSRHRNSRILGICFGHQVIAMFLGGRIRLGEKIRHGEIDLIRHYNFDLYRGIPETFSAVRYHSLVSEKSDGMIIDSVSLSDGTIMGFHSADGSMWGVQFHPESYYSEFGEKLLQNFLVS